MSITIGLCALLISSIGVAAWLSSQNSQPSNVFAGGQPQQKSETVEKQLQDVKQQLSIQMMQMNEQRQRQQQMNSELAQQIREVREELSAISRGRPDQVLAQGRGGETVAAKRVVSNPRPVKQPQVANIEAGRVTGKSQGWMVNLTSTKTEAAAKALQQQLKLKDIQAEYQRVIVKGGVWFRVRIGGFASKQEAVVYQRRLKQAHGLDTWLNRS